MDLQAQDRAHRIGQTRPVLIFRLVSAHTIETKILQKAGNKRKLEALVISQGKFGRLVDENGKVILGRSKQPESMAGMAKALLDLEGEEINVASAGDQIISDGDLEVLLDRSPEAYAREKGWSAGLGQGGKRAEQIKKGERTAFEVSPDSSIPYHSSLYLTYIMISPARTRSSDEIKANNRYSCPPKTKPPMDSPHCSEGMERRTSRTIAYYKIIHYQDCCTDHSYSCRNIQYSTIHHHAERKSATPTNEVGYPPPST